MITFQYRETDSLTACEWLLRKQVETVTRLNRMCYRCVT
jgi:hypothetical protein